MQLAKKVQCRTQWFDGLGNRYIYVVSTYNNILIYLNNKDTLSRYCDSSTLRAYTPNY